MGPRNKTSLSLFASMLLVLAAPCWPAVPFPVDAINAKIDWKFAPRLRAAGNLLFVVDWKDGTYRLWTSDATPAGSGLLKNLVGPATNMEELGGALWFLNGDGGASATELWRSDGTAGGTLVVRDFGGPALQNFRRLGDLLYLTVNLWSGCFGGSYLWSCDGAGIPNQQVPVSTQCECDLGACWQAINSSYTVAEGRLVVASPRTLTFDGAVIELVGQSAQSIGHLTAAGSRVFFGASTAAAGPELWVSDGTAGGTGLVKDLNPGAEGSYPSSIRALGERVVFQSWSTPGHIQLWVTDGSDQGTSMLLDATSQAGSPYSGWSFSLPDRVLFAFDDRIHGMEPWVTDGTPEGTAMLADLWPGAFGSSPEQYFAAGDRVFFVARDPDHGGELWETNGTTGGTRLAADIRPGPQDAWPWPTRSAGFTATERLLFFIADGGTGSGIWALPLREDRFRRGDSNTDGTNDISDAIATLTDLFLDTQKIPCQKAADANDDGAVDLSDAVFLMSHLFLGGTALNDPVVNCGVDPTPDALTCGSFRSCP